MSYKNTSNNSFQWNPISCETPNINVNVENVNYAVLLLNHSLDHLNGTKSDAFHNIWQKASLTIAVDGGVNYLSDSHKIPDIISGDFDSTSKQVLVNYRNKGTEIIETPDQNATDFTKAVQIVLDRNNSNESKPIESIIAIWSSLGRIDQVLANIDTLHIYAKDTDNYVPIFLLQVGDSISWLLKEGTHVIESNEYSRWCSLVPVGSPCTLTTSGLRWNLDKQTLAFGSLISTSNEFDKNEKFVRVETDKPILFSMDISKS